MIVNRRTFIAKKGHMDEAIAMMKRIWAEMDPQRRVRFYRSSLGPFDTIVWEAEYDSLTEYDKAMAAVDPRWMAENLPKWHAVTEVGGANEIWDVV